MISNSNLKSFLTTCKLTLAHICGDESWECKALEQIYFWRYISLKVTGTLSYLLTISSGSRAARCLASGPEFRVLTYYFFWFRGGTVPRIWPWVPGSYLLFLLVPGRHGASHLALSSGFLLTIPSDSGAARCLASGPEFRVLTYYSFWFRGGTVPRIWPRVPGSSSYSFWFRGGTVPRIWPRVPESSSYGLDWCLPVRVRFGVQVTPVFDHWAVSVSGPSVLSLGWLIATDSERNT